MASPTKQTTNNKSKKNHPLPQTVKKQTPQKTKMPNLLVILGDQLTPNIATLRNGNAAEDTILMAEVHEEATYVAHHQRKIAFCLSAMRHFAKALQSDGWQVRYTQLDDADNSGSIVGEIERATRKGSFTDILITEPGEHRLLSAIQKLQKKKKVSLQILEDDRFICSHERFQNWAAGKKQLRMENFYREMRVETDLLMRDGKPEGGKWNYDHANRKPAKGDLSFPAPARFKPDKITRDVLQLVAEKFGDHIGQLDDFWFAVTEKQAQKALDQFIEHALPNFGDYQDALLTDEKFLFHSVLSVYINAGLLDPLTICQRVEKAFLKEKVPLNAAEGFIRQIIGWREYVRGIYWLKMPDYVGVNFFGHKRDLPKFYWTADTDMACMKAALTQTIEEAYAHHIQRLMVTGNFAMLIGADPQQVHQWYLEVYADAYEWVELPNTIGMSQFADGGLLASKPYAAGGNYINKMSDYCKGCRYKVREKTGADACPLNYLYWNFLIDNRDKLQGNHRLAPIYRTLQKMDDARVKDIQADSKRFLKSL
jgi:deoxyribodipyrimidine photolyase-related protein